MDARNHLQYHDEMKANNRAVASWPGAAPGAGQGRRRGCFCSRSPLKSEVCPSAYFWLKTMPLMFY